MQFDYPISTHFLILMNSYYYFTLGITMMKQMFRYNVVIALYARLKLKLSDVFFFFDK